ncbi:TetR/AcrR family transcriptional regulator [Umezawaea tangerina]|uniref:TetR family transcriptional regulator n=1 Tax=Umezawaea tangerina TaxID=84725 RepID=A0A2T0T2E9_9PSEU|nr:TetR/AcrR family transcriptional regulator [Umezawaea tangerina]PRY39826.1 TetR family transcriptional regulator [Umezawaea tangerina]
MPSSAKPKRAATGAAVLSQDVTGAIRAAVLDELADKGFAAMSMDSVARRAGVGKSAIYRRWTSKDAMTVEVLSDLIVVGDGEPRDTGSLRGDVRQSLDEIVSWMADDRIGRIYVDILANGMRNAALAEPLTTRIGVPRRARGTAILDRAAKRGELNTPVDREVVLDLIAAMVFWRVVARREQVSPAYLDEVTTLVVGVITGRF